LVKRQLATCNDRNKGEIWNIIFLLLGRNIKKHSDVHDLEDGLFQCTFRRAKMRHMFLFGKHGMIVRVAEVHHAAQDVKPVITGAVTLSEEILDICSEALFYPGVSFWTIPRKRRSTFLKFASRLVAGPHQNELRSGREHSLILIRENMRTPLSFSALASSRSLSSPFSSAREAWTVVKSSWVAKLHVQGVLSRLLHFSSLSFPL
jgi:hypothetical protein